MVALATPIESILGTPPDAPGADGRGRRPARPRARRAGEAARLAADRLRRRPRRSAARWRPRGARSGGPCWPRPPGPLGTFPPQTLRPGSAVGVSYSSGDIQVGAIGTVAYTDEDRVWAFGHPFEGSGRRRLLLQDAYVYRVVDNPLQLGDFGTTYKLASLGHTLGEISNDASAAVAGRVGAPPPTDAGAHHRATTSTPASGSSSASTPPTRAGSACPRAPRPPRSSARSASPRRPPRCSTARPGA